MNQRTANIIMCCKDYGEGKDYAERIANYMAKECACPVETYTTAAIYSLLKEAARDVIRSDKDGAVEFGLKFLQYSEDYAVYSDLVETQKEQEKLIKVLSDIYATSFRMMKCLEYKGDGAFVDVNGFDYDQMELAKKILRDEK